jgi:hypothetical protein
MGEGENSQVNGHLIRFPNQKKPVIRFGQRAFVSRGVLEIWRDSGEYRSNDGTILND